MLYSLPFKILAVDPATGLSGWSELLVKSLNPLTVEVCQTGVLDGEKIYKSKKEIYAQYSRQYCIVDSLREEYINLINLIKPDIVISEGAFAGNNISAVISLTLAVNSLRNASHVTLNKDIVIVAPRFTKRAFTGDSMADKDLMRLAYFTKDDLIRVHDNLNISEHEIDAVAHGYAFVRRDLVQDIIQISSADKRREKRERQKEREKKRLQKEKK